MIYVCMLVRVSGVSISVIDVTFKNKFKREQFTYDSIQQGMLTESE